jgi:hypothetical protein
MRIRSYNLATLEIEPTARIESAGRKARVPYQHTWKFLKIFKSSYYICKIIHKIQIESIALAGDVQAPPSVRG